DSLPGQIAFQLHDTFGFPVEVTEEILAERGFSLDKRSFEIAMAEQRDRARAARADGPSAGKNIYMDILDEFGPTEFLRDSPVFETAQVLAVIPLDDTRVEIFLDKTPFYAESGGQVGDTGTLITDSGVFEVSDCTLALPNLHRHIGKVVSGKIMPGAVANAAINDDRRSSIRRNHTATHILHWALREILGEHVKQAGSLVAPERLRFDFSHFEAVTVEQLNQIEDLVNLEVLGNDQCRHFETTMKDAQDLGAVAFFGDKYGDIVRVLEAGGHSLELCGGTHVKALGDIGHIRIVGESSIGSNLRRIEAVTGVATVQRHRKAEDTLGKIAEVLNATTEEVFDVLEKRLLENKDLRNQIKIFQQKEAGSRSVELAALAINGIVVTRVDSMSRDSLRDLASAIQKENGIKAVVLAGAPDEGGVALVASVSVESGLLAGDLLDQAAKAVQGGFGRKGEPSIILAGGKNIAGIDEALQHARLAAGLPQD
ncbi:MAG: alanine--tRNA ligase-related protein, partial [Actinomycetota bacterium]|nr:alanine--tRNA ligase-related protein [Actinomycetota bacterium]